MNVHEMYGILSNIWLQKLLNTSFTDTEIVSSISNTVNKEYVSDI